MEKNIEKYDVEYIPTYQKRKKWATYKKSWMNCGRKSIIITKCIMSMIIPSFPTGNGLCQNYST